MKLTRKTKWLLIVLAVPLLLWGERERRISTLVGGTWLVSGGKEGEASWYLRFHRDGTGEQILDWQGKRGLQQFTYQFNGLSVLKITGGKEFCGPEIRPLFQCERMNDEGSNTALLSFNLDRNHIYFTLPTGRLTDVSSYDTWQCVNLAKP